MSKELYDLIQVRRGHTKIVITDSWANVQKRKNTLSNCQRKGIRGDKVKYSISPSDSEVKFKEKPKKWYK